MSTRVVLAALLGLGLSGCSPRPEPPSPTPTAKATAPSQAQFVGSGRCAECHAAQAAAWKGSHHEEAMHKATPETVLGDFNQASFKYFGFTSKFYRKGNEYWVETDGPQGIKAAYQIEYTFGFKPLQQYLIRFPDGRLQALGLCWDTENKRWFHLHPDEKVSYRSSLHWTGPLANWDFMCAECHSTGVERHYEADSGKYHTSFHEVNVGCEACHGPGSLHAANPKDSAPLTNLGGHGPWTAGRPPRPAHPDAPSSQIETCARCHSRRSVIAEPYQSGEELAQTRAVAVLEDGLYHADGQIDDEVYVYGSFLQSKMYHSGVVCTDCHNPHSTGLKLTGDALCLQCHVTDSHSHHKEVGCIDCHMPGKLYMVVDYRRDHSFRIPRPDLSQELGSPNACNSCHKDRSVAWAARQTKTWYGSPKPHYGQTLAAGRRGDPDARKRLAELAADRNQPEIVRATAVSLAPYPEVLGPALKAEGPLIRREAVRALAAADPAVRLRLLTPLANDPVRSVRIEVGRALAGAKSDSPAVKQAAAEYRASLELQSERAEAQLGLAELHLAEGDPQAAEACLKMAQRLAPQSPQAYVNLADFYRTTEREGEGEVVLRKALKELDAPESAPIHHVLGLLLVRRHQLPEAVAQLAEASRLLPDDPRFALTYALGLDAQGRRPAALAELRRALKRNPDDRDLQAALKSLQD